MVPALDAQKPPQVPGGHWLQLASGLREHYPQQACNWAQADAQGAACSFHYLSRSRRSRKESEFDE